MALARWVGCAIGLDVYRDFCVVAICEDGWSAQRAGCRARPRDWRRWPRACSGVGGDRELLGGRADP